MKTKLRKVTIRLEERVFRWAHIEAAQKSMTVSRFLGALLKERMLPSDAYEIARRRALPASPF
jgi:hypothetical protein